MFRLSEEAVPPEESGVDRIVEDAMGLERSPCRVSLRPVTFPIQSGGNLLEGSAVRTKIKDFPDDGRLLFLNHQPTVGEFVSQRRGGAPDPRPRLSLLGHSPPT